MLAGNMQMLRPVIRNVLLCILALFLTAVGKAFFAGQLGGPSIDSDDVMRLVQIKDLLAGQSWFDHMQYRLGLGEGTLMHWSRLVDLPIILLTNFFDLFFDQDTALSIAISIWPPLTYAFLVIGCALAGWGLKMKCAVNVALVTCFLSFMLHYRFVPGAIDHHNLQLGMLALGAGSLGAAERNSWLAVLSGIAFATSAAIGIEVLFLVAAACAFVAVEWAWCGKDRRDVAIKFGASFALTLASIFAVTVAPSNYLVKACDTMSVVMFAVGALGGIGLATIAWAVSSLSRFVRAQILAIFGCALLIFIRFFAPECLHDPLGDLSSTVRTFWLGSVDEARPMLTGSLNDLMQIVLRIPAFVIGPAVAIWYIWKDEARRAHILFGLLLLCANILTLVQVRFGVFGQLFALLLFIYWVTKFWNIRQEGGSSEIGYLFVLALSLPAMWKLSAGSVDFANKGDNKVAIEIETAETGRFDEILKSLEDLPTGRVYSPIMWSVDILNETPHSVLAGNYHRNARDIELFYHIAWMNEADAEAALRMYDFDYVVIGFNQFIGADMVPEGEDSFIEGIKEGHIPAFLEPLAGSTETGPLLFQIKPKA